MLMGCTNKSLGDVKVISSKLCGQKCSHVKGWCGWVQSQGDFDGLDAHGSHFLKPWVKPNVIFDEFRPLEKPKKILFLWVY